MVLYVNDKGEIKDVNITSDESLTPVEVSDEDTTFAGWSVAKMCCHKVEVTGGMITKFAPYVDSRLIAHIDKLGKSDETVANDIIDTQIALVESYEQNNLSITDLELALAEIYEIVMGGE